MINKRELITEKKKQNSIFVFKIIIFSIEYRMATTEVMCLNQMVSTNGKENRGIEIERETGRQTGKERGSKRAER